MSLTKRIERLEQETETHGHSLLIHWQFTEDTQRLHCAGHEFTREPGESLGDFVSRAATTALVTVPGKVLWLDATSTL